MLRSGIRFSFARHLIGRAYQSGEGRHVSWRLMKLGRWRGIEVKPSKWQGFARVTESMRKRWAGRLALRASDLVEISVAPRFRNPHRRPHPGVGLPRALAPRRLREARQRWRGGVSPDLFHGASRERWCILRWMSSSPPLSIQLPSSPSSLDQIA